MEKIYAKVEKRKLVKLFSCPLCHNLFDNATTISECLHTFCRTCIHEKIVNENLKACPVCNVHLGVSPLDKLKYDNTWDDLRQKLFKAEPKQPKNIKRARESIAARKEEPEKNKLREKVEAAPKTSRSSGPTQKAGEGTYEGYIQKDNKYWEKDSEELQSLSDKCKSLSTADKEVAAVETNATTVVVEPAKTPQGKSEELVEQYHILISSDDDTKEESNEKRKKKGKEKQESVCICARRICGKKGKGKSYSPPVLRPRKNNSASTSKKEEIYERICFALVASKNQITDRPLPQIEKFYRRLRSPNIPVSHVKNHILKKLKLESEEEGKKLHVESAEEVEIRVRNAPVCSYLMMPELIDWWLKTTPLSEQIIPCSECSAPKLVMVLHYSRKDPSL